MTTPDEKPTVPPQTSPWEWMGADYLERPISIRVFFDPITRLVLGCTVYRDPNTLMRKIYIGLGEDGTPNTSVRTFNVPVGNTTIGAGPLINNGLQTIDDVVTLQITAGP